MGDEYLNANLPRDDYELVQNLLSDKNTAELLLWLIIFVCGPKRYNQQVKHYLHLGDRSWYVDVIAKPVGWFVTFRQSRLTKFWFQGKHSIHEAGWN